MQIAASCKDLTPSRNTRHPAPMVDQHRRKGSRRCGAASSCRRDTASWWRPPQAAAVGLLRSGVRDRGAPSPFPESITPDSASSPPRLVAYHCSCQPPCLALRQEHGDDDISGGASSPGSSIPSAQSTSPPVERRFCNMSDEFVWYFVQLTLI